MCHSRLVTLASGQTLSAKLHLVASRSSSAPRSTCSMLWAYSSFLGALWAPGFESGGRATWSYFSQRFPFCVKAFYAQFFSFSPSISIQSFAFVSARIYPCGCRELKGFQVVIRVLAKKIVQCFFNLRLTLCDTLVTSQSFESGVCVCCFCGLLLFNIVLAD